MPRIDSDPIGAGPPNGPAVDAKSSLERGTALTILVEDDDRRTSWRTLLMGALGAFAVWEAYRRRKPPDASMQRTDDNNAFAAAIPGPAATETAPVALGWWWVLKTTFSDWQQDQATRLSAALAYYTVFSLAPLLLVVIAVIGWLFGEQAIRGELDQQLVGFVGADAATLISDLVARAARPKEGILASTIGVVMLLMGATGVFTELKEALNAIWDVKVIPERRLVGTFRSRLLSFAMLLSIGFLLLVSLAVSAVLSAIQKRFGEWIGGPETLMFVAHSLTSLVVITTLFALILRFLPDIRLPWKHIATGALFTAILFTVGKFLFGLYLGRGTIGSTYGAAGTVVVILLWAYYSSLIFFLGAEFTQAHARAFGPSRDRATNAADRRSVNAGMGI